MKEFVIKLVNYQIEALKNCENYNDSLHDMNDFEEFEFEEIYIFGNYELLFLAMDMMGFPKDNVSNYDPYVSNHPRTDMENEFGREFALNNNLFDTDKTGKQFQNVEQYVDWLYAELDALKVARPHLF